MDNLLKVECPYCNSKREIDLLAYTTRAHDGLYLRDICDVCDTLYGFDVETINTAVSYKLRPFLSKM